MNDYIKNKLQKFITEIEFLKKSSTGKTSREKDKVTKGTMTYRFKVILVGYFFIFFLRVNSWFAVETQCIASLQISDYFNFL